MFLNELFSTVLQVLVFTLLPFVVYWFTQRKKNSFQQYMGFTPSPWKPIGLAAIFAVSGILLTYFVMQYSPALQKILSDPSSLTGRMKALGPSGETFGIILLTAVLKTGLGEEILFRGFIGKRLINWLGFWPGNVIQALIFGLIHVVIFLSLTNSWLVLGLFFFLPTLMAGFVLYLNEKMANGSILPGWTAHAIGNFVTYSLFAFG